MKSCKYLFPFLTIPFIFQLSACKNDEDDLGCGGPPAPPSALLILKDTAGHHLVGTVYPSENIRVHDGEKELWMEVQDSIIYVHRFHEKNSMEYYVQLDSIDTDTLLVELASTETSCYTNWRVNRLDYNQQEIEAKNSSTFVVTKH